MNVTNVLFIDRSVPDFQVFVDSVNSDTIPILYTNRSIPDWILPESVERIGIVFINDGIQLFGPENTFLILMLRKYNIKQIDFLACNTLPVWKSYYDNLTQETGTLVGASNNRTGNLQYGGDWTMESTGQDIEFIYFTKSIEYYKYLLDPSNSSYIILKDGTVWSAGHNDYDQLGLGTTWPTDVNASFFRQTNMSNVVAISAGNITSLALLHDGTVWSAGFNSYAQLGLGTTWPSNKNVSFFRQTNMSNVVAISAGSYHSLVLLNNGTVWSAGRSQNGQLGLGTTLSTNDNVSFFRQTNMSNVVAISAGYTHSLALLKDGTVWSAGDNYFDQLGLGMTWPTDVNASFFRQTNMSNVVAISAGATHSLALLKDRTVWSAGGNDSDQLGLGTTWPTYENASFFRQTNMSNVVAISAEWNHSLALLKDRTVWSAGDNSYDQLGLGTTWPTYENASFFRQTNMSNVINLPDTTTRTNISPILKSDGTLYTIGNNMNGESGTNVKSFLKTFAISGSSVTSVGSTRYGMLYLKNNQVYYSGYNQYGELGTEEKSSLISKVSERFSSITTNMVFTNVELSPIFPDIVQFSAGLDHSLFLLKSGNIYSAGLNNFGQLGLGNTTNTPPTLIPNLSGATLVKTGYDYSAVVASGNVYTFGNNTYGQLGQGNNLQQNSPTKITTLSDVDNVACGSYHTLFLSKGQLYACGLNAFGQLGLSNSINKTSPTLISLTNIVSISAGGNNSAAIDAVGNLWLWGQDYTSTPVLTQFQVTYANVTLNGIFYVANNNYYLLNGDLLTFSYSNGIIRLPSGSTIPFSVRSNICFLADTPVTTDQGDIPIAKVIPNNHTIRGKKIVAITETFSTEKYLVVMEKDSLFVGCPSQRTVISKEHKLFYQGKMIEACLLINGTTIHQIPYKEEKLYNVLLEDHGRMKVNNMIVETLDPVNTIGKIFKAIQDAALENS